MIAVCRRLLFVLLLALPGWVAGLQVSAAEAVRITEFMASNFRTLADEDGSYEDWLEIHNGTPATVNLQGWYLTDSTSNLKKWQFPSTVLAPNQYLVVFASGKDRREVFTPLHTNFKLGAKGSYLALVGTNGTTVVSEYAPSYPTQITGISYGVPVRDNAVTLISTNQPVRYWVPVDDRNGLGWTGAGFDDSSWTAGVNGLGYDTDVATLFTPVVLADSIREFSGVQGSNNWFYGFWNRGEDQDGVFQTAEFQAFPRAAGGLSATNYFTNNTWKWFPLGIAPTEINRIGGTATGDNGQPTRLNHWVVRRWVSETNGLVRIYGMISDVTTCADPGAGDGTTFHILVGGVEVFQRTMRQSGIGYSVTTTVAKDQPVDFVIEPGAGRNDLCDSAAFTAFVATTAASIQVVADSVADWSSSGNQGENGWFYGHYDRSTDPAGGYQSTDFRPFPGVFWNGAAYAWLNGNPPFDYIDATRMLPNGTTSDGGEHWPIRRWISQVAGNLTLDWHVAKAAGLGSGVTARLFHKGAAKDSMSLAATNLFGTNRTVTLAGVAVGDPIDIALDPAGPGSEGNDLGDLSFVDAKVHGNSTLSAFVATDVRTAVQNVSSSVYVRIPFTIAAPLSLDILTLRMRYDAGFVAYLNGLEILRRNAPSQLAWNSAATLERPDPDAGVWVDVDLAGSRDVLVAGNNVLAIQVLNSSASDSDLLSAVTLSGSYLTLDASSPRYFAVPTPGAVNGFGDTNLGPLVLDTKHSPNVPKPGQPMRVTTQVLPSFNAVSNVFLNYRTLYGPETSVQMLDDGAHGDGAAGDSVYGAEIPASAYAAGNMVRYFIRAFDVKTTNFTRDPLFIKGKPMPEYWGTVVENPALTNPLPVLHWFSSVAGVSDAGGAGSIFYNGQFLDNVRFGIHGQSSSGFKKHSFNIDLNAGYKLTWQEGEPGVDDVNLLTTYPDKARMRNLLAYNTYRDAGTPYHFVVPVRVQLNGAFLGDWHMVENGDDNYLKRLGLDPNGALYKMYNDFSSADGEKKTRKNEGNGDLVAFNTGMGLSGNNLVAYMCDNLDIPEVVSYLVAMTLVGNTDCCHKNYYFYRDSDITGEWQMLPWDQDLSFGRVWTGSLTYWDEILHPDTPLRIGSGNRVPNAIFQNPYFDQMYLRRLRTLMDELLQPASTPAHLRYYESQIEALTPRLVPDGDLDLAKWGTFAKGAELSTEAVQTEQEASDELKYSYLPARRAYLFGLPEIPASQPQKPVLQIGAIDFNPASGDQDEEYFTIINTNKIYIDISQWRIEGAVDMTFRGGTVIPTNGTLYVSPNLKAFRGRSTDPRGGQRLLVQGNYNRHLSARGETLRLVDRSGVVIAEKTYAGAPSDAQNSLRVTEIMYAPSAPAAGSPYTREDFEYIELRNIGSGSLSLSGVRLVNGVEFNFTTSSIPTLAAGQRVVVARNVPAFVARYGAGRPVAGGYVGSLDNKGESLRLVDSVGEVIQEFRYNNSWYPVTDGLGFSLVIVSDQAPWDSWGLKASWRPSGLPQGAPGLPDPAPATVQPVVINEVLASSGVDPLGDAIELLNPAAGAAAVGGWYLTDDFNTPKKYRIPANTSIVAGGYLVVREAAFGGGGSGFRLGADGDEVYLFSADPAGELTGYVTGYSFGASLVGQTLGRHTNSAGTVLFVAQKDPTLGAANSGPAKAAVVVSEILYHPVETPDGLERDLLEYVEIRNTTSQPVPLFSPLNPAATWRLAGGAEFFFPTNLTLPAGARMLLVGFDPLQDPDALAAFSEAYGDTGSVPLLGPWSGRLNNDGEELALYAPDPTSTNAAPPYVVVDWVRFSDSAPWPPEPDRYGASLTRLPGDVFGNDPASWIAASPTPGTFVPGPGTAPSITTQPASVRGSSGQPFSLSVAAAGDSPLSYRWFREALPVAGSGGSTLTIQQPIVTQSGNYQVCVMNPFGALLSSNAPVVIGESVVILKQPSDRNVLPGTNVTFTVKAVGSGKLSYQWFYNEQPLPEGTNISLTLKAVTAASEGDYRVEVRDATTRRLSDAARLAVFDRPQILSQPQPVSLLSGEDATFSVLVAGRGPYGFRWQRASIARSNSLSDVPLSIFTVKSVGSTLTGLYSVVITNPAGASVTSITARLSLLVDADKDGMADAWESANGFSSADASDASQDADNDGVRNLDEYRAGTDPRDPLSFLRIDRLNATVDSTSLEFIARSNRSYTVEFKESVSAAAWQTLTNVMVGPADRAERVVDPYPLARGRIYRLASPAQVDRPAVTPVILQSPETLRLPAGTPASLRVEASGKGLLRFQWFKNAGLLPGATSPILSFGALKAADQGSYTVKVTDDTGFVLTQAGVVTVLQPPRISAGPVGGEVPVGGALQLSVTASGNGVLQYGWLFNGSLIPGANAAVLQLSNAQPDDSGAYSVIIRHNTPNGLVSIESDPAHVIVR